MKKFLVIKVTRGVYTGVLVAGLATACADPSNGPPARFADAQPTQISAVGRYIVQTGNVDALVLKHNVRPTQRYRRVWPGFAAELSDAQVVALRGDGATVTPDGVMTVSQVNPPWGLDRIDQRSSMFDQSFVAPNTGAGATVYIVDTGIRYTHTDFGGRASLGWDWEGGTGGDCYGHGTHVAGTVGGTTYGVAKAARLVSVRVFGCSGSTPTSVVVAGLDWIATQTTPNAVVNMSLGGSIDLPLDQALQSVIAGGVVAAVSAGNAGADACQQSPARVAEALTVAATDPSDLRPSFSNYGPCVDLYAPGVNVLSASITSDVASTLKSGTSMSSPHVAGVAALTRSANPGMTVAGIIDLMRRRSTKRIAVASSEDADLIYSGLEEMAVPPGSRPVAGFTSACVTTTCQFTSTAVPGSAPIVAWNWVFSGAVLTTSTLEHPSAQWHVGSQQSVTLVVTDANGLAGRITLSVPVVSSVSLAIATAKVKSVNQATLTWSATRGSTVWVTRFNGTPGVSSYWSGLVPNTGSYLDLGLPGGNLGNTSRAGYFYYSVCEQPVLFANYQCSTSTLAVF